MRTRRGKWGSLAGYTSPMSYFSKKILAYCRVAQGGHGLFKNNLVGVNQSPREIASVEMNTIDIMTKGSFAFRPIFGLYAASLPSNHEKQQMPLAEYTHASTSLPDPSSFCSYIAESSLPLESPESDSSSTLWCVLRATVSVIFSYLRAMRAGFLAQSFEIVSRKIQFCLDMPLLYSATQTSRAMQCIILII